MKARTMAPLVVLVLTLGTYGFSSPPAAAAPTMYAQANASQTVDPDQGHKLLPSEQNTVDIVSKYGNSVVAVNVTVEGKRVNPLENMPPQLRPFLKQFLPPGALHPQRRMEQAAGSGFVIDKEDQIITNYHVIRNALAGDTAKLAENAKLTVRFPGQDKELPVKVVGVDQSYDLALLQVENQSDIPKDVRPLPLADSNKVEVGEKAIAIGNPFGLESTVTQGIVSAVNRRQAALVSGVPISYIQTDAAINPGNSGGPLLDSSGQVIGINDEILAPNGTFIGVGFAIPSNLLQQNLARLKKGGFIKKAEMGVTVISLKDYPKPVRETLNLPSYGVMIVQVAKGSPADKAGLQGAQFMANVDGQQWPAGGDVILEVNGEKLQDAQDLQKVVFSKHAGEEVTLKVLHKGKTRTVTVKLAELSRQQNATLMHHQQQP